MSERLMRWSAVAIAVLALIDPSIALSGRTRPRLGVAASGGGAEAVRAQEALRRTLSADFEIVAGLDPSAKALVVVGDRYPAEPIAETANVSTVSIDAAVAPTIVVSRVSAPAAAPPATAVRLGVEVTGTRSRSTTSELSIRAGGAEVARRSHTWSSDAETWRSDVDVVPVGDAPYLFEVRAGASHTTVAVDNAPRFRILVVESRPSWATAFVRRALEGDPRFEVSGVSASAPQAFIKSGPSPALPDDLRLFDAILVGGLDRLSSANLATFERFTRDRGGVLVLLPDATIPAAVSQRLLPGIAWRETLLERPAALDISDAPKIEASELLEAIDLPAGADVFARAASSHLPVMWSVPSGDGRILVSGAMDAWRYRGGIGAPFERFWRSVVSGAALAARPAIDVTLIPERAAPGDRVSVVARVRALEREQFGDRLAISARIGAAPIRLWPDSAIGTFKGSFIVDARANATTQRVTATIGDGTSGFARLTIDPQATARQLPPLSWLASTRRGMDVKPSEMDALARHLRQAIAADSAAAPRHPMRSAIWFVPFAACLSLEWWLRRRRGAR
jgi:hypothetical protein